MRNAVDYFGLMAYLWVMSGGMPESELLPRERAVRSPKPRTRTRRRLRVIEGGLAHAAPPVQLQLVEADEDFAAA